MKIESKVFAPIYEPVQDGNIEFNMPGNTPMINTKEATAITHANRLSGINVSIKILVAIAFVASLYFAHAFFVPLLIGILVSYTLSPIVEFLNKYRMPRVIGALLVLAIFLGILFWLAFSLRGETSSMIEKFPDAARKLRQQFSDTRPVSRSILQNMQETANQLEGLASDASINSETRVISNQSGESTAWLSDFLLKQSMLLFSVVAQAPIVVLLAYFLLASGTHFRRKIIQLVGPSLMNKKDAVQIFDEIDMQIQLYLLSMLIAGLLVGISTWIGFKALGMEQAGMWGVIAALLQFIPYLGPSITALSSGVVSYLQFGSLLNAVATASVALVISVAIGLAFTTWLQSRFAHINAAVLFIALLFFAWLWGVWGLLLGAPLVAIVKVICDRVESLKPIGELLGQ